MLEIVICEDNLIYQNMLYQNINAIVSDIKIIAKIVLKCSSPKELKEFLGEKKPNVFFIDIDLNSTETGYELAISIQNKIENPYIVFISRHTEYVFKSFKARAFDFLPKPSSRKELEDGLVRIYQDYSKKNTIM